MNKRRIIFLLIFISAFLILSLSGEEYGIGIAAETIDGIYLLILSCPPFSLISFSILLGLFVYASYSSSPNCKNTTVSSLKRRFLGFFIDFPINVLVAGIPVTLMAILINWFQSNVFSWVILRPYNPSTDKIYFILYAIQVGIVCMLFGYPISRRKQSIGGIITNTYIEPSNNISLIGASLRSILGFITLAAGVLSIPWAWASKDKRMWHDLAFGTFPTQIIEKGS